MNYSKERVYALDLSDGISEKQALIALAMAAYRLAPSFSDEAHPDRRDPDDLGIGEAAGYVAGDGVTMLFARDKMTLTHLRVLERSGRGLLIKVVMLFDDDADDKLFALADAICRQVFADAIIPADERAGEEPFLFDPEEDLAERQFSSMAPLMSVAAR